MIGEINFCIAVNDFMRVSVVVYYTAYDPLMISRR